MAPLLKKEFRLETGPLLRPKKRVNQMFEVVVIETNTVSTNPNLHAYWTELFETHDEAIQYYVEVLEQDKAFNQKMNTIAATVTMLIFDNTGSDWQPERISIVELP